MVASNTLSVRILKTVAAFCAIALLALSGASLQPRAASAQPSDCLHGSQLCYQEEICDEGKFFGLFGKRCVTYFYYFPDGGGGDPTEACDQMSQAEATNEDWHTCALN